MGVTYNYGAGPTYTKIASQTLSGASATVTFSNLPQSYTDLVIVCAAKGASAESMRMQFNSDTATNYSTTNLFANLFGSPEVDSTRYTSESSIRAGYVQNGLDTTNFLHCTIQIQGYANNTTYKSVLARSAKAINVTNGLWRSASAITSVALFPASSANFASGSTFSLYGIAAALKPKATGGDITTDGTYFIHTFKTSGVFQPNQNVTADYLVVAGGGGGGGGNEPGGGGGGAGGYRTNVGGSALSLTSGTNYTVTVGAGGAGGIKVLGNNGSDSVFSTITSTGGGRGAGSIGTDTVTSGNGGSGGGGARPGSPGTNMAGGLGNTPSTSPSQGNDGGNGRHIGGVSSNGGGGGGSSAAGQNASDVSRGGNGGNGSANSISGSSVTYAGGGGGGSDTGNNGTGGTGGGGAGANTGVSGTTNLGGGGGGSANYNSNVGAGGSGIVIVRYSA